MITAITIALACVSIDVFAHGVDENTRNFLLNNSGVQFIAFMYIGAKHMITGYDHLLFLVGVIFFLFKPKEILLYVSMFTLGHSVTLLLGVIANIQVNAYLIDAVIAFSVVYKAFDNLGGIKKSLKFTPDPRIVVLIFGLFHGFGLVTKIQEFSLAQDGLITNLIAFNIGVELGQFSALALIVLIINAWRKHHSFIHFSNTTNGLLMSAGFMLIGLQLTGYFIY
ncbi:HupE/UreJ family protein [Colwelliaceae bacterium 6441]